MRALLGGWRRFYGENPMHLLALLGCFALVGYVLVLLAPDPSIYLVAVWFIGAVLAHDLVLYPLYALADRSVVAGRWVQRKVRRGRFPRVPAINHLRIPVMLSVLLLVLYWPSVLEQGDDVFLFAAGRTDAGYLAAWLAVTAVLLLGSAVIYAIRLDRAQVRARRDSGVTAATPSERHPRSARAD